MIYLIYNKTHENWCMPDFIGYTEYYESAGIYSDRVIKHRTGIYCNKSGDSKDNVLVNFYTMRVEKLDGVLTEKQRKHLINLTNIIRKARGMPLVMVERDGLMVCPYCYKPVIQFLPSLKTSDVLCGSCRKPIERD